MTRTPIDGMLFLDVAMSAQSHAPAVLEPEYLDGFREIFEEKIVFNQTMGLKVDLVVPGRVEAHLDMRHELIGHYGYGRLHGGVISASMDAIGSAAVLSAASARHRDEPPARRLERFTRFGTIDLRVDYLRPAIGERFSIHAECLRVGSRVGTARMEFRGADGTLLSVGAAAYIVS